MYKFLEILALVVRQKHVIVIYCVFFIAVNVKSISKSFSDTVGFLYIPLFMGLYIYPV